MQMLLFARTLPEAHGSALPMQLLNDLDVAAHSDLRVNLARFVE
jgi:hypothetical protein